MNIKTFVAKIFLTLFVVLTIQFLYFGITTTPEFLHESDSLVYHIPIAREFAKGNFMPPKIYQGLGFYPSASELILSIFVFLKLSLNTFGVLAFISLFFIAKKVAEVFGVSKETAIVYAGVIVTLQSVLRWPLTQTVDIWLAVFFLASLYLLKKTGQTYKYFLSLGIVNGFLIGTKYSGLPFFLILICIFGKEVFTKIDFRKLIIYLIPVLIFGFSWYIRNFALTGNPLYPASLPYLMGDVTFTQQDSSILTTIIKDPLFILKIIEATFSEFLVWSFVLILPLYIFWNKSYSKEIYNLNLVGMLVFIVFVLFLPSSPIVSNLRYIYPAISVLVLSVFLIFKNKESLLFAVCLMSAMFSLVNLDYHPKVLILSLIPTFYLVFVNNKIFDKIKTI